MRQMDKKISILAWDVCHNAVGRAFMLADMLSRRYAVEIVGARFPRYGGSTWQPIRDTYIRITSFEGTDFPGHFERMRKIAESIDGDLLLISKPRLPSIELAILASSMRKRPIIIDVDDYEPAFFDEDEPLTLAKVQKLANEPDLKVPYGSLWTRYAESLIPSFDALTVSNACLLRKFGGQIIPHARDERRFDPALYDRQRIRTKFGFSPADKVILFLGTPRRHKGILDVLDALRQIDNPDYKLCVVGNITDYKLFVGLLKGPRDTVRLVPSQPFIDLPANLMLGDLICLLQDPRRRVSEYQMPAKFTDALAMGIPVIASPAAPMIDVANEGLAYLTGKQPLAEIIDSILQDLPHQRELAMRNRKTFLADYSYSAVLPRLEDVIERVIAKPGKTSNDQIELLSFHKDCFGKALRNRSPRPGPPSGKEKKLDIVFFWKQNDSDIYGRRQDMLVKHLARSERVGRIVHFDAPINALRLAFPSLRVSRADHSRLVLKNTISRMLGQSHNGKVRRHAFCYLAGQKITRQLPQPVLRLVTEARSFRKFVERKLSAAGITPASAVFYNWPLNYYFPEIHDYFRPALTVTDMIDDQRTFYSPSSSKIDEITRNYGEIISRSDIILANCQKLVDTVRELGGQADLVPNGVDLHDDADLAGIPPDLEAIPAPRIGYAGNLSSRIDIDLLDYLARRHPRWNLVLIGSAHLNRRILELTRYKNVHLLGVRTYPEVRSYIRHFDVAIIPHQKNAMTDSMHPMKLLIYAALSVPIVSTDIDNLGEFRDLVTIGRTPEEFCAAVEKCLSARSTRIDERMSQLLSRNSWDARVADILRLIEQKSE
ncbi:MAG TPA: glycosyltransferase [Myxococcota bacterium]|nr:glycosyltransferase [Myxococcota bacterium]